MCVVAMFFTVSAPMLRADVCRAPESMKARLQGNPTAEAFTDLGIWFGEHKQYACAADAFGFLSQPST